MTVAGMRLTLAQLLAVGKEDSPSKVKFTEEDGGGYLATLEFPHQLHCLDLLRKYTYHEYYEKSDPYFQERPEIFRAHLDHCVEILRQNLMCSADVGMITFEWVSGHDDPYPDFNTKHRCRVFEKLLAWAADNAVQVRQGRVSRLGNEIDLPEPP
ncbi:hypothetical protein GALMADRAFT_209863 [Galerina marginata CBS 339.88]|uniref:Uncharacterized protein n=1 Tax=Galerina marginata (strain CBS 339.88) TaxID=685588 RepID=A0A067TEZ0_GALM3|nr:hypothetical protein GALMADRAFT_209863 [Galerina marginata CBS 339.88]